MSLGRNQPLKVQRKLRGKRTTKKGQSKKRKIQEKGGRVGVKRQNLPRANPPEQGHTDWTHTKDEKCKQATRIMEGRGYRVNRWKYNKRFMRKGPEPFLL